MKRISTLWPAFLLLPSLLLAAEQDDADVEPGFNAETFAGLELRNIGPAFMSGRIADAGIVRPFVELEFARIRLANIYVSRPWQLAHGGFLQTAFSFRKATYLRNVVGLAYSFLSQEGGWQAAWMTLRLQATLRAARKGGRLYRRLRRWNTRERVEAGIGKVLGCSVRLVVSPFGGLSLDVDDEDDFRILTARYAEWMVTHNSVISEYPPAQSRPDQSG